MQRNADAFTLAFARKKNILCFKSKTNDLKLLEERNIAECSIVTRPYLCIYSEYFLEFIYNFYFLDPWVFLKLIFCIFYNRLLIFRFWIFDCASSLLLNFRDYFLYLYTGWQKIIRVCISVYNSFNNHRNQYQNDTRVKYVTFRKTTSFRSCTHSLLCRSEMFFKSLKKNINIFFEKFLVKLFIIIKWYN